VAPLSIERTRQIVDQCITTYLLERLKHTDGDASGASTLGRKGIARSEDSQGRAKATRVLQPSDAQADHHSEIPILTANIHHGRRGSSSRQKSGAGRDRKGDSDAQLSADNSKDDHPRRGRKETSRSMFEPLEDYILTSFGTLECINNSFIPRRHSTLRTASEAGSRNTVPLKSEKPVRADEIMSELDPKTLLLGDIAENGSWWTGERAGGTHSRSRTHRSGDASYEGPATIKSPRIDWPDVNEWYYLVLNAGRLWRLKLDELTASELYPGRLSPPSSQELDAVDAHIMAALGRTHRVLLKATESLLKRPGRPLYEPNDLRFLLIILANPLLYPSHTGLRAKERSRSRSRSRERKMSYDSNAPNTSKDRGGTSAATSAPPLTTAGKGNSGKHSGIIKRILGLLSNVPNECHHHLVSWFARYSDGQFQRATDLIGSFVTYRLTRQDGQKREVDQDPTADLIPSMSGSGRNTSAALHAALGSSSQSSKKIDGKPQPVIYNDDWQIKAAARVMALFFSANNSGLTRRGYAHTAVSPENGQSAGLAARERAHNHGQILPTSNFYNTLLDYSDLIADFEAWEGKRGKFTFCQYPFFLSIWAKIQIMEHDARRQMEVKAREAFFDSIMTHKNVNQYLVLKIRRDCLVEDSLKGVSEVVGSGDEEIKKGLRIEFKGEEGIDAGGLRKEWFLLLVRDVFNPEHGMYSRPNMCSQALIVHRNVYVR
jgi:E3 ubiquitin-protein ligase HECTD2